MTALNYSIITVIFKRNIWRFKHACRIVKIVHTSRVWILWSLNCLGPKTESKRRGKLMEWNFKLHALMRNIGWNYLIYLYQILRILYSTSGSSVYWVDAFSHIEIISDELGEITCIKTSEALGSDCEMVILSVPLHIDVSQTHLGKNYFLSLVIICESNNVTRIWLYSFGSQIIIPFADINQPCKIRAIFKIIMDLGCHSIQNFSVIWSCCELSLSLTIHKFCQNSFWLCWDQFILIQLSNRIGNEKRYGRNQEL